MRKLLGKCNLRITLTKFEAFLQSGKLFRKTLDKIYPMLVNEKKTDQCSRLRWEWNLRVNISSFDWEWSRIHILDLSTNVAIRETFFKICNTS